MSDEIQPNKVVEGDFATVKVQLAPGGTEAPERPTKSTQLVWGGDGPSSPWGLLRSLIEAGGGAVNYTYLHAGALLKARNAGNAEGAKQQTEPPKEEKKEEEAKADAGSGPLFDWGVDFEFDNKGKKDARVWAHPRAAHAGPRPLVIWLHGIKIPAEHPQLTEKISRDWCLHAGKLAAALIDTGKVTPLVMAAPTCEKYAGSSELWTKFDLGKFVQKVADEVKAQGVEIDLDDVSVVGHSGAGCDGSNGLHAIAKKGASFDGHALKVLGFADTCASAGLAAAAARGLKDNPTTAIYAVHKGHGGGSRGDKPEEYAKGFGAKNSSTAFVGNEDANEIDDFRDNGSANPARISAHLNEAALWAHEDEFVADGAMKSGWNHHNGWAPHYIVCLLWIWYALPRFHPAKGGEKAVKKAEGPRVTGGEWADVPAAPPIWTPPEGASPKATGAAEFADPASGIFWPVRGRTEHGRTVCFRSADDKLIGYAHKGGFRTENREFLAERKGEWKGRTEKRYHAAIDLFGDYHDLVVACEPGTILNWHFFYHGVYKLFVQCDSGLVINYGEVDEGSKSEFKLAPGKRIVAGQPIARIGRMTGGGHMLHFETYPKGTKDNQQYWHHDPDSQLGKFRNAALYLLALARTGK